MTASGPVLDPVRDLQERLGYFFSDPGLLELALTPPSSGRKPHNQRLEFLGDALLGACVALLLHQAHPTWEEGPLSKLRGMLVCTDRLHEWARSLGIELYRGPRTPKTAIPSGRVVADAMEAVLAAIFLDSRTQGRDGFRAVLDLVQGQFGQWIGAARLGIWEAQDSKTTLQELSASRGWPPPVYEPVERSGPDHAPRFRVRVRTGGLEAEAVSGTRKQAEMEAARLLLDRHRCTTGTPTPLSLPGKLG